MLGGSLQLLGELTAVAGSLQLLEAWLQLLGELVAVGGGYSCWEVPYIC
jgi:hypothetical protein